MARHGEKARIVFPAAVPQRRVSSADARAIRFVVCLRQQSNIQTGEAAKRNVHAAFRQTEDRP